MTSTRQLLKRIADDPEDLSARWYLAIALESAKPKNEDQLVQLVNNLVWLARHYPEDKAHQEVLLVYPNPMYDELKRAWKTEIRRHPGNTDVAINAGHAFVIIDKAYAERCYKKAIKISPLDADMWWRLSHLYSLQTYDSEGTVDRECAIKSVDALLTAMKCQGDRKDGYVGQYRRMLLMDAAKQALTFDLLKQARTLADLLLEIAKDHSANVAQPRAVRQHNAQDIGNAVLGLVALKQGQMDAAVRYLDLIEGAVNTDELVLLLANSLLRKRERAVVNRYIQSCRDAMLAAPGSDQEQSTKLADWQASLNGKRAVKLKPW